MKAGDEKLTEVFTTKVRYEIPIFQRPYTWDEDKNWLPLWEDLRQAAERAEAATATDTRLDEQQELFLGALVTQHRPPAPKRVPTKQVIDGQQRMTTLQVFFASAHRVADELHAAEAADSFRTLIRNPVSSESDFPGDAYKVTPLPDDAPAFRWSVRLADDDSVCPVPDHKLVRAAAWFEDTVRTWAQEAHDPVDRLDMLYFAVTELIKVVSVFLDARDDPQVIFEALNFKGEPLDPTDLVKNLLFQRIDVQGDHSIARTLHEQHWRLLDDSSWRRKVTTGRISRVRADILLAYWLSAQLGDVVSVEHLYATFKTWLLASEPAPRAAEVVADIRRWADTMDELVARPMTDPVRQVIDRLEATNTTTPWPMLLFLHASEGVPPEQATLGARALDSFLMRRAVCGKTAKDYNRLFGSVLGKVRTAAPEAAGQTLVDELASQTADARSWPTDSDFIQALVADDIYNAIPRARLRSLLVGLDTALHTDHQEHHEPLSAKNETLTVEHILPQHWEEHWPLPGERDAEVEYAVRTGHVHQLGNLTLTVRRLNSTLSNAPWSAKRPTIQKHSLLRLTTSSILTVPEGVKDWTPFGWEQDWDESRIQLRTFWLTRLAMETWSRPEPSPASAESL